MSTDNQGGNIVWLCDCCDATFERPREDGFDAGWAEAKAKGWRAKKIGKDWVHACPDCELDR